jgi:hypothetical protein
MDRQTARVCVVGAALIVGCASYPKPTDRLIASEAALRGAQEAGAQGIPRASLHLRLAQEELGLARQLMNDGYDERADSVLMRAKADADLALALARTSHEWTEEKKVEEKAGTEP